MSTSYEPHITAGKEKSKIKVKISHRIIELFSEGLYSSPHKAIEELVSNSFDAGAQNVHVILSPDLQEPKATIVVIDDGEGMDENGMRQHWIIGMSNRRGTARGDGRKPIGKFGIGKLATYVLAERLTHICRINGQYLAATMDYTKIDPSEGKGVYDEKEEIELPFRELKASEAEELLRPWTQGGKEGFKVLKLFGKGSRDTWTVAIMSGLKEMGQKIQRGRLKWILRTAMPLRPDFNLFLDGVKMEPSKLEAALVKKWIIGKDIIELPKPGTKDLEPTEDNSRKKDSKYYYGLTHHDLGRITGFVELYEDPLDIGKSEGLERSNGFFVYVHERLINVDDPGFGINRNLLQHGTFSRLRVVVHMDGLDEDLRSSRESLRQGNKYNLAQDFLHAIFNIARNQLLAHDKAKAPGALMSARLSAAPGSITRKPIYALARLAINGEISPLYTRLPAGLSKSQKDAFLSDLQKRIESQDEIIKAVEIVELSSSDVMVVYGLENGKLQINAFHPFVASFLDEFQNAKTGMPLELLCLSEVLMEANLYAMNLPENTIHEILARRDELFRQLVRSSGRRTALMVSSSLMDVKDDEDRLEEELRAAFEVMGFANVIRLGKKGKPDATAEAHISATEDGKIQRYKVGLEAKSGQSVSAHRLNVSGIARHMEQFKCDHHLVAGNGFATSTGEDSATVIEITKEKEKTGRTITLIHIDDLARLVRLIPAKRISLSRLRGFFQNCITPEDSKKWVDAIDAEIPKKWPFKEILETISELSNNRPNEAVAYPAIYTALEYKKGIRLSGSDLKECCKAIQVMSAGGLYAREDSVEIDRRPDLILADIRTAVHEYPEAEQEKLKIYI